MAVWPTNLKRECITCGKAAKYIDVPDEGETHDPLFLCATHGGDEPEPPQFTLVTDFNGEPADSMICTFVDDGESDYCGDTAEVFVLIDGSWEYDCLCGGHMGTSWMPYNLHHWNHDSRRAKRPKKPSPAEIEALMKKMDEYERHAMLSKIGQEINDGRFKLPMDPGS